jgi:hypothetical protein
MKVDLITSFFNLLYYLRLRRDGEDKNCCIPSKRRVFDIRSFYNALNVMGFSWFMYIFGDLCIEIRLIV